MEDYDLNALVELLIRSAGMKRILEALLSHLDDLGGSDLKNYLITLRQNLQHTLDIYEKRYEDINSLRERALNLQEMIRGSEEELRVLQNSCRHTKKEYMAPYYKCPDCQLLIKDQC